MGDDVDFTKLPLEECCTHKLWKARLHGYTEAARLFKSADDEKAPIFGQFLGLIGKFVGDSNAVAQEKGLEAVLLFVQNSALAGKTVKDVMSIIVSKSIAAPKAKTKELSVQIALMYIEIEKQEQVIEELVKGLEHKNPKIVAACVSTITQSLREFGSKVIAIKPFIKFIGPLLEDRDKTVRDEGKAMVVEIFRWIKDAIKPQLTTLKPVHLTELEVEFEKVRGEKAAPTRLLRSQQEQQAKMATEQEENGGGGDSAEADEQEANVDPYDLMDPINVLSQIPSDFYEKIEAKKWQERKEAIESLEKILEYPKFERGDYADLVRTLLKVVTKDLNVMVVGIGVKCIARLALGLKKGFQPYAGTVLPNLLEKFKEKKANVVTPLREAVDAIYPITTLEAIQEDLISALENKNPAVKAETASFLARCFTKCTPAILNKKLLKVLTAALLKTLNESDPTVRDNSAEALGTAMKVVGEKVITQFMPDLDNLKLNKIKEFCEKAVVVKPPPTAAPKAAASAAPSASKAERSKSETTTGGAKVVKPAAAPKKVSSVSSVKKVSSSASKGSEQVEFTEEEVDEKILEFVPEDVLKGLGDSAWKARLDATECFANCLKSIEDRDSVSQVLIKILTRKPGLKDSNCQVMKVKLDTLKYILEHFTISPNDVDAVLPDVVEKMGDAKSGASGKLALLEVAKAIASAVGPECRVHTKTVFRAFLAALGDSKQWVRAAALDCINTWGNEGGYEEYFDGEVIPDALKSGSATLRTEIWTWMADLLPNVKTLPKDDIVLCVPYLYNSLEDRNSDVRKSSQSAVLPVMIHVGYQGMVKQTEKLAPGSKTKVMALLEKLRPELPVQPEVTKTASKARKVEDKAKQDPKAAAKGKGPAATKTFTRKKEEEVDLSPLLPINNMKNQRLIDEQKLKTLKWNFTIPRSEFVDLLKEQMTNAGFNKTLVTNMFHSDFKYHLRAIDSLSEDISNSEAIIANLDLILKWMTLRFFDTNPSVLLKGLEYLQNVFSLLIENGYTVFDIEANSFIPYLVIKLGDPKDTVRDRVRAIIKQLSQIYPPAKLFALIMEGLKSKNARQRAECLEELGNLIGEFGMSVCQPTPSSTLKEISKQISDRDNAVRSAALNAIVKVWFIEGDKVYKMIGQSEKDMSLLEERIKRASKGRPPAAAKAEKERTPEKSMMMQHPQASQPQSQAQQQALQEDAEEEADEPPSPPTVVKQRQSTFGANLFKELDLIVPPMPKIELIEIDDSFLDSPVTIPERIAAKMNRNAQPPTFQPKDMLIEHVIREVASPNIDIAFQATTKLRLVFASDVRNALLMFTDQIMDSFITQLKLVNSYSLESHGLILQKTYTMLFRIIDDIFGKKTAMADAIKVNHLQMLIQELLIALIEDKTAKFAEDGYNKLINAFISRIIENADHTNITCALIKSLFDVVGNPPSNPKLTNFTTKCLVKVIVLIRQANSNWLGSLDLDEVLYECHLFFQAYPRHTWKDRPSQGPQKAIKTLLLLLVSLKGKSIFSHLKKIENPCASELSMFLKRLLKTQPSASTSRLSKAMSEHLSDIFMKIANEETAKEGLLQFYEFKKQNPNLDLSSFLAPTSKYFQEYVENGLRNIEKERGALKPAPKKVEPAAAAAALADGEAPAVPDAVAGDSGAALVQYYVDKLRVFQDRVGIHLSDMPDFKTEHQS